MGGHRKSLLAVVAGFRGAGGSSGGAARSRRTAVIVGFSRDGRLVRRGRMALSGVRDELAGDGGAVHVRLLGQLGLSCIETQ